MIKIGGHIGALNTILLIILTATIGIYYARIEGLNTIRSGVKNIYENKTPIYEMISGASIAIAAVLLILPGFVTDFFGFIILFPVTRKIIIKKFIQNKDLNKKNYDKNIFEGEIIEDKKEIKKEDDEI